ncbi:MAG: hypothetical protein IPL26_11050 [Leptospiraceae bacterium]|nr:hypothetical protein [Leptospiraceae bacterium]
MQTLHKSLRILCLFIIFSVAVFTADNQLFAESIRLTSGQVLDGRILSESEKVIIIQTSKGTFTIKKTDILEMERPDSKETIAKPPIEENPSLLKIVGLSLIPGYSPTYISKERPEFGLPFAMGGLYYFYRFMEFQTNSRAVGFMNSVEMKNPIMLILNVSYGPSTIYNLSNFIEPIPDRLPDYGLNLSLYINFRSYIYNKSPDRIVMGVTMTEDEYLNKRRSLLQNYLAVSAASAITAYFILNSEKTPGVLKTEHNGVQTIFYAFPTMDGGLFGTVSRF